MTRSRRPTAFLLSTCQLHNCKIQNQHMRIKTCTKTWRSAGAHKEELFNISMCTRRPSEDQKVLTMTILKISMCSRRTLTKVFWCWGWCLVRRWDSHHEAAHLVSDHRATHLISLCPPSLCATNHHQYNILQDFTLIGSVPMSFSHHKAARPWSVWWAPKQLFGICPHHRDELPIRMHGSSAWGKIRAWMSSKAHACVHLQQREMFA